MSSPDGTQSVSHGHMPNLMMFGIGAGWPIISRWGGEPRLTSKGRMDGVWVYQFDIGDVALERLEEGDGRSEGWQEIYAKKGKLANSSTKLHKLGGYDMFTAEEWDNQVGKL